MLTCIPKLKTGLKPAKDFPDLTNYVISQDVYTLKKEDKKKKLYIKKGVNRRECSFEEMEAELKEGSIRETTPIGVGSCEKWYYAGNVDGLNLNQKIRLQTKADYPTPEKNKSNQSYTGYDDTPILAFLKQSDRLMEEVKQEVENCIQKLQTISVLNSSADEEIEKTYKAYVDNYEIMDSSMKKIEGKAKELDECYTTAKNELEHNLQERKLLLELAFKDKKEKIIPAVRGMVDGFISKKPFDQCKGYQVSPLKDWDGISAPKQLAQHFLYLGKIHRQYTIFGQDYMVSRREYLELLNFQNLIIHFDNKNKEQCLSLVSTLVGRLLKATEGQQLQVHVVDPKHEMGLNDNFNHLSSELYEVYEVVTELDTADVQKQENGVLRMTKGKPVEKYIQSQLSGGKMLGYHVVVFQDWYATLDGRIDENELKGIVANSVKAGYCFIFMVNDDEKKNVESRHRVDDGEILSELPNCAKIILDGRAEQQLELMDGDQLFAVVQSVQQKYLPQPKDIDVGSFLEERRSLKQLPCKGGFSLFVGKDSTLRDKELRFEDDIIHQSLLVNYRKPSVFMWMNAMIAQAFTMYNPEELNVMVADFTGNKDIAAMAGGRNVLEPPFYYLGWNANNQTSLTKESFSIQFSNIVISFLERNPEKRLLTFVVGKCDDITKCVINRSLLSKENLNLIILSTDYIVGGRDDQTDFEGYKMSFGPRRINDYPSRYRDDKEEQAISGEEFMFNGIGYRAYTFSNEATRRVIYKYAKEPVIPSVSTLGENANTDSAIVSDMEPCDTKEETLSESPIVSKLQDHIIDKKSITQDDVQKQPIAEIEPEKESMNAFDDANSWQNGNECEEVKMYGYQRMFRFVDYMLPQDKWWKDSCAQNFEVPFGVHINVETEKDEVQNFSLSTKGSMKNVALVLGGMGSGKTAFLQTLIMGASQRYSPNELEFYLIDFKNTGFLPFERYKLPHARVVAGGADREFGISILETLSKEQQRRQIEPEKKYPRTILIIDECQDFFLGDDLDFVAEQLILSIIKKGREQKMNIIIATHTLSSIPKTLYESIAIRAVAKPEENDYYSLFNRSNSTERLTLMTSYDSGEWLFVENTYMGTNIEDYHLKSFYIPYEAESMGASELKNLLDKLNEFAKKHKKDCSQNKGCHFFHNDDPLIEFTNERMLKEHRDASSSIPKEIHMYLGQPIAISNDYYLTLKQQKDQNVLIMGVDDAALGQGITINALLSSLPTYPVDKRVDYVFDFTESGEPLFGEIAKMLKHPPFNSQSEVVYNNEKDVMKKLKKIKGIIDGRKTSPVDNHVFLTILGLDRGNMFGEGEDEYDVQESTTLLKDIIKRGPQKGVFTIIQFTGRLETLDMMLDNSKYSVFTHVVALQMSWEESDNLISNHINLYDQELAQNNPGLYRILYYNRKNPNIIHKLKPYKF